MIKPTEKLEPLNEDGSVSGDYTIYPTSDGYKSTLPWVIKDYEEKGAFTAEHKRRLSERYDLAHEMTDRLSLYVGNCLDVETATGFYRLTRSSAVKNGRVIARRALRHLKAGKSDEEIRPDLADLGSFFLDKDDAQDTASLIADTTRDLKKTLEKLLQMPDALASKVPDDKRAIRDSRRILVVEHCCYVWLDAGREVTYTTSPANKSGDRRGGELFELITEVIAMVTEPSKKIPEETLRADVDTLKKRHGWKLPAEARPDFMRDPPKFGKAD